MNLTPEQQNAAESISEFLSSPAKEFVLTGYAGTGKTYTIGKCLDGKSVVYAAPTHKAVWRE